MKHLGQKQQGFTLIEIAIVLVIIGLLLGGVLKGQELIENGKIKNLVNDANGVSVALNSYRDRYRAMPGDDAGATAARGWAAIAPAASNGLVGGANGNPYAAGEQTNFWRGLRYAGLVTGDPTLTGVAALPTHAGGGRLGVTRGVLGWGASTHVVCFENLNGKYGLALDAQLDDGLPNTGTVRSTATATGAPGAAAPAATPYNENNTYQLCRVL